MSFPKKEERAKCWTSRDEYFKCLDTYAPQHSTTSGEAVPDSCKQLRQIFEKACPKQWVVHFDRSRNYDQFKKKLEKGYEPIDAKTSAAA